MEDELYTATRRPGTELTPGQLEEILSDKPPQDEQDEDKRIKRKTVLRILRTNIIPLIIIIFCLFFTRGKIVPIAMLVMIALLDAAMIIYLYAKPAFFVHRYAKMLRKYGKENLAGQIRAPETVMFLVTPGNISSYSFITPDFLIVPFVCVISLNEIKTLTLNKKEYPEELIVKSFESEKYREDMRNIYMMPVKYKNGKVREYLLAVRSEDARTFIDLFGYREHSRNVDT